MHSGITCKSLVGAPASENLDYICPEKSTLKRSKMCLNLSFFVINQARIRLMNRQSRLIDPYEDLGQSCYCPHKCVRTFSQILL